MLLELLVVCSAVLPSCALAGAARPHVGEATLQGVVARHDGEPWVGASVELYAAGIGSDADWWSAWGSAAREEQRLARTTASEGGAFVLSVAHTGPVYVRAVAGPGVHALDEVTLPLEQRPAGLRLQLPPVAEVAGRVLLPVGVPTETLRVRVAAPDGVNPAEPGAWDHAWDAFLEAPVDAQGFFRMQAVPRETLLLLAVVEQDLSGKLRVAHARDLHVTGASFEQELDLRERWFRTVPLELQASNGPASGLRVTLAAMSHAAGETVELGATVSLDENGRAEVRLVPGAYRIRAYPSAGTWSWSPELELEVPAPQPQSLELRMPAAWGSVRLVGEDGSTPLAGRDVHVITEPHGSGPASSYATRTDADGRLRLLRLDGWVSFDLNCSRPSYDAAALESLPRVRWTVAGPVVEDVACP